MDMRKRTADFGAKNSLLASGMVVLFLAQWAVADSKYGMVLISARTATVGTCDAERVELGERFNCHPTWLGDDLPKREGDVPAFWIDRHPVTNSQYLAFAEAVKHPRPAWWNRWGGVFPKEYADHPVVGVSGKDAEAYAAWAGKRLLDDRGGVDDATIIRHLAPLRTVRPWVPAAASANCNNLSIHRVITSGGRGAVVEVRKWTP